jgi:isoleucyl-tRNA synthetase
VEVRTDPEAAAPAVAVRRADGRKCSRCWCWSAGVGETAAHPEVCPRCAAALAAIASVSPHGGGEA